MSLSRIRRLTRHPVVSGRRLMERVSLDHRLPLGQVATMRRLLRAALGDRERALVIGPPGPVRQAWPTAHLDVVGQVPDETEVTVVSEALGSGSLPQRWDCVVITELAPPSARLCAAVEACTPMGVLALAIPPSMSPALPEHARIERVLRSRRMHLVVARVAT